MKQGMRIRNLGRAALVVLCLSGVMGTAVRPAHAQQIAIGVVDEDKLAEGFTKYRDAIAKLDKRVQGLDEQLRARELLEDAEAKRFDELVVRDNRNKGDEDALQALVRAGLDRRAEFIKLSGTATRTEADNARIKKLQEQASKNQAPLRAISDSLYNSMKKVQEETDKRYTDQAKDVVAQVASDKKLSVVVRLRAVIWTAPTIDITQEVLTRLNKA